MSLPSHHAIPSSTELGSGGEVEAARERDADRITSGPRFGCCRVARGPTRERERESSWNPSSLWLAINIGGDVWGEKKNLAGWELWMTSVLRRQQKRPTVGKHLPATDHHPFNLQKLRSLCGFSPSKIVHSWVKGVHTERGRLCATGNACGSWLNKRQFVWQFLSNGSVPHCAGMWKYEERGHDVSLSCAASSSSYSPLFALSFGTASGQTSLAKVWKGERKEERARRRKTEREREMYIGALPVRDGKEEVKGVEGKSEREREKDAVAREITILCKSEGAKSKRSIRGARCMHDDDDGHALRLR